MKLIKLSCSAVSFKSISFAASGLTLIVGGVPGETEGSSNGVGKTLALTIVHHCLGAKTDARLRDSTPEWVFRLDFIFENERHVVERSGDSSVFRLDGSKTDGAKLRGWLDERGPFVLPDDTRHLSFRSLFSRFARLGQRDSDNPIRTDHESAADGLLRTGFLLGLSLTPIREKRRIKERLDALRRSSKDAKGESLLRDIFKVGANPRVRLEWLDRETARQREDLSNFQVSEDYRSIELAADDATARIRSLDQRRAVIQFEVDSIKQTLEVSPDISRQELLELYSGLSEIFKPEALEHFASVEKFHRELFAGRQRRLLAELHDLRESLAENGVERERYSTQRDNLLRSLNGKRALDEYSAIAQRLASLEEERRRIHEFIRGTERAQSEIQELREALVRQDREALDYANARPLERVDSQFQRLSELLYPGSPAGLIFEADTGKNQVRFKLDATIEGDEADGINAARIVILDWILLTLGSNHSMGFLWHDNRLFAHMDPVQRARWIECVECRSAAVDKQYIATLNLENYESMRGLMPSEVWARVESSVRLRLAGNSPKEKLLGKQVGRPR